MEDFDIDKRICLYFFLLPGTVYSTLFAPNLPFLGWQFFVSILMISSQSSFHDLKSHELWPLIRCKKYLHTLLLQERLSLFYIWAILVHVYPDNNLPSLSPQDWWYFTVVFSRKTTYTLGPKLNIESLLR